MSPRRSPKICNLKFKMTGGPRNNHRETSCWVAQCRDRHIEDVRCHIRQLPKPAAEFSLVRLLASACLLLDLLDCLLDLVLVDIWVVWARRDSVVDRLEQLGRIRST